MLWLILALLIGVGLAAVVVGLVAVPAHREGRTVLTERGERVVSNVTDHTDKVSRGAHNLVDSVAKRRTKAEKTS